MFMGSNRLQAIMAWAALVTALAQGPSSLASAPAASDLPAGAPALGPSAFSIVQDGIAVELKLRSLRSEAGEGRLEEADPVEVELKITDQASGVPLTGLNPAAWMDLIPAEADRANESCKQKVATFLGGSLLSSPQVDLNTYFVLALNADPSISVVDPLFGFGGSKLLALVDLASPGEDWVLNRAQNLLFVSLPDSGRVAVVDTETWKIKTEIATGGRPTALALAPDGRYLWVADEGGSKGSGVAAIDTQWLSLVGKVPTGAGRHELAISDDSRFVFVSNADAGTVTAIEAQSLAVVKQIPVGGRPVSLAFSSKAQSVYVADQTSGKLTAIDIARKEPLATLAAEPGISSVRFEPSGRFAFIVNPEKNTVAIADAVSNRVIQTADVNQRPDQVSFTSELAYVRHLGSEEVLMIPLRSIGKEGQPVPVVDFTGGQNAFGEASRPAIALGIVPSAEPHTVLVANPGDKMIYFYKEGMAAPMGSFKNYRREPRAALVVDRSLRELAPGQYRTTVRLGRAGAYDLAFLVDSPKVVDCFRFQVAVSPELEKKRLASLGATVEWVEPPATAQAGDTIKVRFRLLDAVSGEPRGGQPDVRVQAFLVPGIWAIRLAAMSGEQGVYEVEFPVQEPGAYVVQVEAPSLQLRINRSPALRIMVAGGEATPEAAVAQEPQTEEIPETPERGAGQ